MPKQYTSIANYTTWPKTATEALSNDLISPLYSQPQWTIRLGDKRPTMKQLKELLHTTRLEF